MKPICELLGLDLDEFRTAVPAEAAEPDAGEPAESDETIVRRWIRLRLLGERWGR